MQNGGATEHGASNGALRRGKGTAYEGGTRVPTFIHWNSQHFLGKGKYYDG